MPMNELLWFIMLVVNFGSVLLLYRYLGKQGIYVWVPIATILANIQVIKIVELFGVTATLGNIAYGSVFLATDILSENHSREEAKLAVWIGFFSLVIMLLIMSLAVAFVPAEDDFAQASLKQIFSYMPRVVLGSLVAFLVSQMHDIASYHFWKRLRPETKWLWLRNNASTLASQMLDTLIFTTIAFVVVFPWSVFWSIAWTTYAIKALTALLDTPCLYWAKKMHTKNLIKL